MYLFFLTFELIVKRMTFVKSRTILDAKRTLRQTQLREVAKVKSEKEYPAVISVLCIFHLTELPIQLGNGYRYFVSSFK